MYEGATDISVIRCEDCGKLHELYYEESSTTTLYYMCGNVRYNYMPDED